MIDFLYDFGQRDFQADRLGTGVLTDVPQAGAAWHVVSDYGVNEVGFGQEFFGVGWTKNGDQRGL